MMKRNIRELKLAIEVQHGGTATLARSVLVREDNGQTAWGGAVHVFDFAGHPQAKRAYAWSYDLPDSKRRFCAVPHMAPIKSPKDAVRAAIVAEHKHDQRR